MFGRCRLLTLIAVLAVTMNFALAQSGKDIADFKYVKLRNGKSYSGRLLEVHENGVVFEDDIEKQIREFTWKQLDPVYAENVKKFIAEPTYDDVDVTSAVEIVYRDSKIVGLFVSEDSSTLTLRRHGIELGFAKSDIKARSEVIVNESTVCTPREMFERREKTWPHDTPEDMANLGDYARSLDMLDKAVFYYRKALEFELPVQLKDRYTKKLDYLVQLAGPRARDEELKKIEQTLLRKNFDEAAKLVEQFKAGHPNHQDLVASLETTLQVDRDAYERTKAISCYFKHLRKQLQSICADHESYGDAVAATLELPEALEQTVALELNLDAKKVRELMSNRRNAMCRFASFGTGSFLINSFSPRGRYAASSQNNTTVPNKIEQKAPATLDSEAWWKSRRRDFSFIRYQFLLAVFATSYLEVLDIDERQCANCGGTGSTKCVKVGEIKPGEVTEWTEPCEICQGIGWTKAIKFR